MRPLAQLDPAVVRRLEGVAFDLDDTVLTHGVLTLPAYHAMWSLAGAGLRLLAVTGRPAGWGDLLARQWPVEAVIAENGALAIVRVGRNVAHVDPHGGAEREGRRARLRALVDDARAKVPDAVTTDDAWARVSDVTWDIAEARTLPETSIAELVALAERYGARTSRSSVHLHATFDGADKATGVFGYLSAKGEDEGAARGRWLFVGDSGNDAACFAAFHATVGVANVRAHLGALTVPPRWVTRAPMGDGFAELASALLAARAGSPRP
jgi:HAD superfamily hydrolase (TIGR01484 family)